MIFVVAVVAVAASAAGPAYYAASQTSILRDSFATAPVLGRGIEVTESGPVSATLDGLSAVVDEGLGSSFGPHSAAVVGRVFQAPVQALEATAYDPRVQETIPLVWRSGVCSHLLLSGSCPQQPDEVVASRSLASTIGLRIGERITVPAWGALTVTGLYIPPTGGDYWFDRLGTYFPAEFPPGGGAARGPVRSGADALFTVRATLESAPPAALQGTDVIDVLVATAHLRPSDVAPLESAVDGLISSEQTLSLPAIATSDIPVTVSAVRSAWSSLAIPVVLVSAQILVLGWLLLFILVTDQAEARGAEVALAKLRGQGRVRTLVFGLSEPVLLLVIALPVGVLVAWGATVLLARGRLAPGTTVAIGALSWAAAAGAVAGGLTAVLLASWRMLRRPVVDQWRRAGRRAAERGWVVDAILLTAAAAGLVDLLATGTVSSAHKSPLALLVPGLLGLAVAVVASRLLPVICRAATAGGRTLAGLGTFLALRHVGRRPEGARTTIMIATSFALATFALAAWAVNERNDTVLARAQVGAPYVIDVSPPLGTDLSSLVARADPTGRHASPVIQYESNGVVTMAVDPSSWGAVATWPGSKPRDLAALLDPPSPDPVVLAGSEVQLDVVIDHVSPPGSTLVMDVDARDATAPTPLTLGVPPPKGRFVATASLPGCPCLLQDLTVEPPPSAFGAGPSASGSMRIVGIASRPGSGGRWASVSSRVANPGRWSSDGTPGSVRPGEGGLQWDFAAPGTGADAVLAPVDRPSPLPAVAASALSGGHTGPKTVAGLDGHDLGVDVNSVVPTVPGSPADGVVVDLQYATLAAGTFISSEANQQVWVSSGSVGIVESRLRQLGVGILGVSSQAATRSVLGRQGPGLARVLFLAEAGVAAALAAGGAILGLYISARRRRYEYAALAVSGLSKRSLLLSLVSEQLIVVVFGLVVGVATGVAAVAIALRAVPEFVVQPVAPRLSYAPPGGRFAVLLLYAVAVVLVGALVAGGAIIRGVKLEQLREAPA
jgi:hypothetical protein